MDARANVRRRQVHPRHRVSEPGLSRRIAIVGVSGNGKTTLARALAQRLGVPHIEMDALCHGPNWTEASDEELRRKTEAALQEAPDGWVVDSLYERKLGNLVLERAETVVWLDQPLLLVLRRLIRRALVDIRTKRDLFNGNRQTWRYAFFTRDSLVAWAIKMQFARRRSLPAMLAALPHLEVVRLRSPAAVRRWFEST